MDERPAGSPEGIRQLAAFWRGRAEAASSAADTLGSAARDISGGALRLRGDYAAKVGEAIGDLPGELRTLSRGYGGCSTALDTYATSLAEAQRQWDGAEVDHDAALADRRAAEYDLDRLAPGWESQLRGLGGDTWVGSLGTWLADTVGDQSAEVQAAIARRERAQDAVSTAERLARQAAELRGEAEAQCVDDINRALEDSGLRNSRWYEKVGNYLKESFTTWDGFVRFCGHLGTALAVVAIFASGPFALLAGAALLALAAVALADDVMAFASGEIGWRELAIGVGVAALTAVGGRLLVSGVRAVSATKAVRGLSDRARNRFDASPIAQRLGDRGRNAAHRAVCTLTGHPVDVATGKVFTDATDLELPGPLPLTVSRTWFSTSTYAGPLGHGWHHSLDTALYVTREAVVYRSPDGRFVDLLTSDPGATHYERTERLTVARDQSEYRLTDADGLTWRFSPATVAQDEEEAAGTVVRYLLRDVVSRAGHRTSLAYDERDRLVEVVDSSGRDLRFEHDDADRITALHAPHPELAGARFAVARYAYDEAGNLLAATDALGNVTRYEYEGRLLVRETDRTGLTFHFAYDGVGERARCVRTWGDGGIYERTLSYEAGVTTVVDSLGHATRYEHTGGLVVRTVDALGAATATEYEWQQPVTETDGLGRVRTWEYDHRGNLLQAVGPDGATVQATHDERDLPVRVVDPVGGEWAWEYDDTGLPTRRRDPLGAETRFTWASGLLQEVSDALGGSTRLGHDEQGLVVELTLPTGATTRWERDRLGRPVAVTDALGAQQRLVVDLAGRVVRVNEPDGNVRELSYDGEGYLTRAVDRLYDITLAYQGMGRLASRSQAGTTVRFEYDTEEQLTGVVNEHGHVYRFSYGPTGQVTVERGFDGVMRLYEHDQLGRTTAVRRASGIVSRLSYDSADRLTAVEHSDGTSERLVWRADGLLAEAANDTCTVAFGRDLLGRVLRETTRFPAGESGRDRDEYWVASEYDALGRRVRMRSSLGADQRITRDAVGDVTAVAIDTSMEQGYETSFTRDALGQELTRQLPGGARSRWHRDRIGRPVRHEITTGTGAIARDRAYDWDVDGRLRGIVDSLTGPITYTHDGLGQLVSATYGPGPHEGRVDLRMPDAVGNLFRTDDRTDRTYGPAGQVLSSVDDDGRRTEYSYDPEGNLTAKATSSSAGELIETWAYTWGADGHLTEVTRPDGTTVTFTYDALARRLTKTYRGQTTHWVWDGDVPLHEWVTGTLQPTEVPTPTWPVDPAIGQREAQLARYLRRGPPERGTTENPITWYFEPETFAPLARIVGEKRESIVTDHLGAPLAMVDPAGETTWSVALSVWGKLRAAQGESWICPNRWPGQYEDPETGLRYNRHRYYDPASGQYVSQDPIRLKGDLGQYHYVHDCLAWTDAFGLARSLEGLSDNELLGQLDSMLFQDKRIPGVSGGTHGLVHRYREQIQGQMRPGSRGWRTHEKAILEQQSGVRARLLEAQTRGLEVPSRAWKIATAPLPTGNQRNIPFCMR